MKEDLWEYEDMSEEDGEWPECHVEPQGIRGVVNALIVEAVLLGVGMVVWWVLA